MTQHLHTACAKAAGLIGLLLGLSAPVAAATLQTFNNAAAITIPGSGNASPYPSAITVSGVPTNFTRLEVQLNGYTHSFPDDVDVLLVGPQEGLRTSTRCLLSRCPPMTHRQAHSRRTPERIHRSVPRIGGCARMLWTRCHELTRSRPRTRRRPLRRSVPRAERGAERAEPNADIQF